MVYTIKLKKLRESKFCVCDKDSIPSIIFDFRTPAKEPLPGDPPVNSSSLEKSLLAGYPGVPTVLDDSQVFISLCFIKNFFLNFIEFFLQLVSCLRILYLYFALGANLKIKLKVIFSDLLFNEGCARFAKVL